LCKGTPLLSNYAASKAYILTLGAGLHDEPKKEGVDVTLLSLEEPQESQEPTLKTITVEV